MQISKWLLILSAGWITLIVMSMLMLMIIVWLEEWKKRRRTRG